MAVLRSRSHFSGASRFCVHLEKKERRKEEKKRKKKKERKRKREKGKKRKREREKREEEKKFFLKKSTKLNKSTGRIVTS